MNAINSATCSTSMRHASTCLSAEPFASVLVWFGDHLRGYGGRRWKAFVLAALFLRAASVLCAPLLSMAGTTALGSRTTQTVVVPITSDGTVATIEALTSGAPELDFSIRSSDPSATVCTVGAFYRAGDTCSVNLSFAPLYPGRRAGAVRVLSANRLLLAQVLVNANASGSLPVLKPGRIDTIAGSYGWTYTGDNVKATGAQIFTPKAALLDGAGNLILSDTGNNRIRRVDAVTNLITTIAGAGFPTYSGDGGQATAAMISGPSGLALDGAGNLYFADYQNSIIRRIDGLTGIITTIAGTPLHPGYGGDGGPATVAQLNLPEGLAFDLQGNLLIADSGNNVIRKIDAESGTIDTVAGTLSPTYNGDGISALTASLADPTGITVCTDGSILIADTGNQRIRRVGLDGIISTVAGNGSQSFGGDGGAALQAAINGPANVAMDPAGDIYFTDAGNNRVRMVNARTGQIETITGGSSEAFSGDGGGADLATHYGPFGLFYSPNGDILLTDMFHMRVRRISALALPITYPVMRVGKTSTPQLTNLINDGNDALVLSAPGFDQSALDTATTSCFGAAAISMVPSATCSLGVEFAPTQVGNPITGTLSLPANILSMTPVITLTGQVLSVNPTSVAVSVLAPSTNPSMLGDNVTVQAVVTSDDKSRTGNITFTVDGVTVCNAVTLAAGGTASCTASGLLLGPHFIVAAYSGDAQNAASTSLPYTQVVKQRTVLLLLSSASTAVVTKPVTFTLSATAVKGIPTGMVTFLDGAVILGTASLDVNGHAGLTISNLGLGTHGIVAEYVGDGSNVAATSATLKQSIRQGYTSISAASDNASTPVGAGVTLRAAVTSLDGLTPTGTITFRSGNITLGSVTLQADSTGVLALANLLAGNYNVIATYSGDTDDAASSSIVLTQSVNRLSTVSSLTTNTASLNAGAALRLAAQVAIAPGVTAFGTISGTVTFTDNGLPLGSATVFADGSAVFDAINLAVGAHNIIANYGGDANYAGSSASRTQTVVQTASFIAITPASSSVLAGKIATLVATVTSSTGTPTGKVIFEEGSVVLGTATLEQGIARFSTSTLPAGSHALTANYAGDVNYLPVSSNAVAVQVVLANTAVVLAGPGSAVTVTNPARFSAALSSEGVQPTGTLTLYDGEIALATQQVTGAGSLSFSVTSLSVGRHSLTAYYSGDAHNAASTSTAVLVDIQQAGTTTTLVTSGTPALLGQDVTFTATVTSGIANLSGMVRLFDGGRSLGSSPLVNGVAKSVVNTLSFGTHSLTAVYAGDAQHSISSSNPLDQRILELAKVDLASSPNPSISGQTVSFAASVQRVAGMTPTGSIAFYDAATVLGTVNLDAAGQSTLQTSSLSVGPHSVQAVYSGDINFPEARVSSVQLVKLATTRLSVVGRNPATYGNVTDLTATVQSDGSTATGTVQFTESGSLLGSAVLDGGGVAVLHLSTLAPGQHTIVAVYAGDGKAASSTASPIQVLVKQQTTLTLSVGANPALTLDNLVLTAILQNSKAAVATGSIVFLESGKPVGAATLDAIGVAHINLMPLSAGVHSFTATYQGDDADFPASAATLTEGVNLRSTRTDLSASFTSLNDTQQVTLIVIVQSPTPSSVASPSGLLTLYDGSTAIGTVQLDSNGVATFTTRLQTKQTGSYKAVYPGDAAYASSTSDTKTVDSGLAAQFSLNVSNTALNVARAQHTVLTVTASSLKGFSDNLKLGCVGLPYAATCTFTSNGAVSTAMSLAANGSGSMQLTVDTGNPLGGGSETSTSLLRSGGAVLCMLPAGLLLLLNGRRRCGIRSMLLLCAGIASAAITGCGGLQMNSTPAGTYTFQVTAVGQTSGVSESQTVTLTVGE